MKITDSLTLDASGLNLTRDGYLVGEAKVSRAGNVQNYRGFELGMTGDEAGKVFGVYRDPDVVFDEASMMSLAGRPVTRGHPPAGVNADNWRALTVGQVGGIIRRDGEHVVAPMAIMDAGAVKEVMQGARSLSAGYTVDVIPDAGTAPDGTPYQFRQAGALRFNHVAYLPENNPRAGNTRIGDDASSGLEPITTEKDVMSDTLKTVVLGDKAVQIAVADVAAIEAFKADAAKTLADAIAAHATAIAAKDEELGALKADLKKAQDALPKPSDLDRLVADRVALVTAARAIDKDIATDGVTDADIRKAAVAKKLGADMVKDASDAEITGMFKALCKDAKAADPVRDALNTRDNASLSAATDAHKAMVTGLQDAWKTKGAA
jgi:uncharacterized protein